MTNKLPVNSHSALHQLQELLSLTLLHPLDKQSYTNRHKVSIYNFAYPIDGLTNCIRILGMILKYFSSKFGLFFLFHLENGTFEKTAEQACVS